MNTKQVELSFREKRDFLARERFPRGETRFSLSTRSASRVPRLGRGHSFTLSHEGSLVYSELRQHTSCNHGTRVTGHGARTPEDRRSLPGASH